MASLGWLCPWPRQERVASVAAALKAAAKSGDVDALRGPISELLAEAAVLAEMASDEGYFALREVLSDAASLLQGRVAAGGGGGGGGAGAFAADGTPAAVGIPSPAVIGVQMMAGKGFEYVREDGEDSRDGGRDGGDEEGSSSGSDDDGGSGGGDDDD